MAMRICLAASEGGLNLTGATFMGGGEPPTPAKVREITRTGARFVPVYAISELGQVGIGCARPADSNDLHFFKDAFALIQHPRVMPGTTSTVNAFYFSSLLPSAPKILMNVESDDYGLLENRSCGCSLEKYGFTEHLSNIFSFSKLNVEGMTLLGSRMIHILEDILPRRFGGSPLDYQLLEEEDDRGFTKLSLIVSPKVLVSDEREIIKTVLKALGDHPSVNSLRSIWGQAGTLQVKRMEPVVTSRGKLMPLHMTQFLKSSS
jgi:hypothetical protein